MRRALCLLLWLSSCVQTFEVELSLEALLHPRFAPGQKFEVIAAGVPASPGAAKGRIVYGAPAPHVGTRGQGARPDVLPHGSAEGAAECPAAARPAMIAVCECL